MLYNNWLSKLIPNVFVKYSANIIKYGLSLRTVRWMKNKSITTKTIKWLSLKKTQKRCVCPPTVRYACVSKKKILWGYTSYNRWLITSDVEYITKHTSSNDWDASGWSVDWVQPHGRIIRNISCQRTGSDQFDKYIPGVSLLLILNTIK